MIEYYEYILNVVDMQYVEHDESVVHRPMAIHLKK